MRRRQERQKAEQAETQAALEEILRQDDVEGAKQMGFGRGDGRQQYYDACIVAIEHGAANILKDLLAPRGFDLGTRAEDKPRARHLFALADASPAQSALMPVLIETNKTTGCGKLETRDLINKDSSIDDIQPFLEEDISIFADCLDKVESYSTEKLGFILSFTTSPQPTEAQQVALDNALVAVVAAKYRDKAELLLAKKANPNYSGAKALMRAAENEDEAMLKILLPLVDLTTYGSAIATRLEKKSVSASIIASIKDATNAASAATNETAEGLERVGNTMVEAQKLPHGLTLTTIFDFSTRQQKNIVTSEDGNGPTPTIINFDDMGKDVVDALTEKFNALGKPAPSQITLTSNTRLTRDMNSFRA